MSESDFLMKNSVVSPQEIDSSITDMMKKQVILCQSQIVPLCSECSYRFSNSSSSFNNSAVGGVLVNADQSGWPASTQAVYQILPTAIMASRIRRSTIPPIRLEYSSQKALE